MAEAVLDGVVAFLCHRTDGDANVQNALLNRLRGLGARIASSISREVTHVIFQPQLTANSEGKKAENAELRLVYAKVNKVRRH